MKIVSVNIGSASGLFIRQSSETHCIMTAIHKQPVSEPVLVGRLGLRGDEQVDLTVHGGLDKAVYAYPVEHYAFWNAQRKAALRTDALLPPGSVGENLTIQGLLEEGVWIGDRLHAGTAVLEVTEPRQPCFKFNAKMGFSHASKQMLQAGISGFYLRVVETGVVQAGDAIALIPGAREVSLASINERRYRGRQKELF